MPDDYWDKRISVHKAAAENLSFEPWVRNANAQGVVALRRAKLREQWAAEGEAAEIARLCKEDLA